MMFRSRQQRHVFGHVPVGHIVLVVLLLGLTVTTVLVLNLEWERAALVQALQGQGRPGPGAEAIRLSFLQARGEIIKVSAILFLLAVVGVATLVIHHNYRSINRALERTKTLARNILDSIASGVVTLDRQGRITSVNPSAERILGIEARKVAWRHYTEAFHLQRDLAEIVGSAVKDGTFAQEVEVQITGPSGRPLSIRLSASELRDLTGEAIGVLLLVRDCTELADLERQLRQADKMAALGTLSAGLAHEIRNPLSAVDLNLRLLEEEIGAGPGLPAQGKEYLEIVKTELRRLSNILETFVRFSRPPALRLERLALNEVIGRVVELLAPEARERGVEIRTAFAPELPSAPGDETQLSQVFLNIMINGIQAMPEGGVLSVATGPAAGFLGFVEARFADTGKGMPPEILSRLFDPFFTTREGGTGLGLAIAYRIVKDHHGFIEAKSLPGAGTTILVRLPTLAERA